MSVRVENLPQGVRIHHSDGMTVTQVRILVDGVASVVRAPAGSIDSAGGLFGAPPGPAPVLEPPRQDGDTLRLSGAGVTVLVDLGTGELSFADPTDPAGPVLIAEAGQPEPLPGLNITRTQGFTIGEDEALHGLGQFREAPFDYRDGAVFLAQSNSDAINPFLTTTGGWGLLWDTGTAAHLRSSGTELAYHSVAGDVVRYHVVVGASMDQLIQGYRRLTGEVPLFGKWAYGFWQSQERYHSQAEVLAIVDGYRSRGLPLDAVVLDWRYWGENDVFSSMTFDPQTFPDPRAMMEQVHAQGAHLIASIWPAMGPNSAVYQELEAEGLLFDEPHWSGGRVYDASSEKAREIYWRHVKQGLIDIGVDGLWTDGTEPEFMGCGDRYWQLEAFAGNGDSTAGPIIENLLTYSYYQSMGLDQAMRRDLPAKRPFVLSRSAYAGQQAFGSVTWSGDIFASWQTLRNQIVAAQNFSMSGNPYWTCDIGAFLTQHRYPDGLADPAYKELYVRWFQFGAMLPIFRAHGTGMRREVWAFGEAGDPFYDAMQAMLELRYALTPYTYSNAAAVTLAGDTLLRGLVMDFPADPGCRTLANQFMVGHQLMARIVDRPLQYPSANAQEFLPHTSVQGLDGVPAAEVVFYEGTDFGREVYRRRTDDLKMTWFGDQPRILAGMAFSARWTGRILAAETGVHTLSMIGKGALRLVFDGRELLDVDGSDAAGPATPVVDQDGATPFVLEQAEAQAKDAEQTMDVDLVAGTFYDVTIEMRQPNPDVVTMWFEWISPSQRALSQLPERAAVDVYLPAGTDWYDYATGQRFSGGQRLDVEVPLDHLPLYARAGAIIPTTPGVTQAGLPTKALQIAVYAGADGEFTLYDDAGDGDGYQRGEFTRTTLTWSDADRTLTVGARRGSYPEMPAGLPVTVRLIDGSTAESAPVAAATAGPAAADPVTAVLDGRELVLRLG